MMRPLARAATAISPASVRSDLGAVVTLGRLLPRLLSVPLSATKALMQPYSAVIEGEVENAFIRNWLDMLCFLLSGAPASGTAAAEIGFMFDDWFRPNAALEYPVGSCGPRWPKCSWTKLGLPPACFWRTGRRSGPARP